MGPAGLPVLLHRHGADEVEPQEREVGEVVPGERFPVEVGVDEPKPFEAALAGAERVEAGDHDLAVCLPGDLAEVAGKLEGEHPGDRDFAAVELLDAPDLVRLESGRVAIDAVDGERTSGCPGLWLKAKGLGPERRKG